jgi:hypothetical protein
MDWLGQEYGEQGLSHLVHAALSSSMLGLAHARQAEKVFAGLLNCLPVECRREVAFSTGLRHSPRRPFRWITLDDDPAERRQLARLFGLTVIEPHTDFPAEQQPSVPIHGWAAYIACCVREKKISAWEHTLSQPRHNISLDSLDELGNRCLLELRAHLPQPTAATTA